MYFYGYIVPEAVVVSGTLFAHAKKNCNSTQTAELQFFLYQLFYYITKSRLAHVHHNAVRQKLCKNSVELKEKSWSINPLAL